MHIPYVSVAAEEVSEEMNKEMLKHVTKYNSLKMSFDRAIASRKEEMKKSSFRFEKTLLPKFEGNVREYPQFRKDFRDLVLPSVGIERMSQHTH